MISVIIPTHNRANILPRAINSVLAQTYQDFEIIVVDDCSSDNTDAVIKALNDPRIQYIKHSENKGGAAARNTGIKASQRQWVAFLDSDDEWLPEKLMKQISVFNQNPKDTGLIYTGLTIVDGNGNFLNTLCVERKGHVLNDLLVENFISSTSSVMVKKEYLELVDGFDFKMKSCQDWDLYVRLGRICQFCCVPELLVKYYLDTNVNRISNNKESVIKGHLRIQEKFKDLYQGLSLNEKITHWDYMSHIYLNAGSLSLSVKMVFQCFINTLNPIYLLITLKRIGLFIKRRTKIGFHLSPE